MSIADSFYQSIIVDQRYQYILEGLKNTLLIAFFALFLGLSLGILIALIRNS